MIHSRHSTSTTRDDSTRWYDIINGKKDVEQARKEYNEIANAEMMGKKHDYLSKLTFQPMPNAGDADMAMMKGQPGEAQPAAAREPAAEKK